jgi:DNA repair photolyase
VKQLINNRVLSTLEVIFIDIESEITLKPRLCSDPWFWINCAINPYRGCQFNCLYCDGKADYYRIPNFGRNIRIKKDVVKNLKKSLRKLGFKGKSEAKQSKLTTFIPSNQKQDINHPLPKFVMSVGGGVTDAYQPIEKEKKITQEILKILIDFEIPAFFLTKSTLMLRDLDLIGELNDRAHAEVNISVGYSDENIRRIIEPHSASTHKRFEVLHEFRKAGIPGGISMMPLAPFIGDSEENIETLLQWASQSKAEHALIAGLTLKPGNRELFFKEFLIKEFPQYLDQYKLLFPENNTYGIPKFEKVKINNVMAIGHDLCKKYNISPRIKRYIPEGRIKTNYLLAEHLHYVHYLFQWLGKKSPNKDVYIIPKFACTLQEHPIDLSNVSPFDRRKLFNGSEFLHRIVDQFLETGDSEIRKKYD